MVTVRNGQERSGTSRNFRVVTEYALGRIVFLYLSRYKTFHEFLLIKSQNGSLKSLCSLQIERSTVAKFAFKKAKKVSLVK
jgi:hypothetical protein